MGGGCIPSWPGGGALQSQTFESGSKGAGLPPNAQGESAFIGLCIKLSHPCNPFLALQMVVRKVAAASGARPRCPNARCSLPGYPDDSC